MKEGYAFCRKEVLKALRRKRCGRRHSSAELDHCRCLEKWAEKEFTGTLLVHEFLGKNGIAQVEVGHSVVECVTAPVIPQQAGDTFLICCI